MKSAIKRAQSQVELLELCRAQALSTQVKSVNYHAVQKDHIAVHSALNNLLNNPDYHIPAATVISNEREIYQDGKVTYMPVYLVMFMKADVSQVDDSEYLF